MIELTKSFTFEAAHTLERVVEREASRRIHGHSYRAEITLAGEPDPASGMLIDLGLLERELSALRARLDHHFLDELPGLYPATLERLARFIFEALAPRLPGLAAVAVCRDSLGERCLYRP
jgi:6-pyruvoyltetrahydropterin/6-carboxytetrahydropterin synthase